MIDFFPVGKAQTLSDMSVRESFNPESYELDKNFRLTRFAELKGTGCKVGSKHSLDTHQFIHLSTET